MYFYLFLLIGLVYANPIPEGDPSESINLHEGDILLEEQDVLITDYSARNANIRVRKWPNGVIPFVIDANSGYSQNQINTIIQSMKTIETQTNGCLRFVPRTSQSDYVRIRHTTTGCNSFVGRAAQQPQQISIQNPGCVGQSVVIHELLHAAGFEHEQNRPDRDQYVQINYANIQTGAESQFRALSTQVVSTLGQPYDINSIMHYRYNAFSKNGQPTITSKVRGVETTQIGNRNQMSAIDIKKVKIFYGCPL